MAPVIIFGYVGGFVTTAAHRCQQNPVVIIHLNCRIAACRVGQIVGKVNQYIALALSCRSKVWIIRPSVFVATAGHFRVNGSGKGLRQLQAAVDCNVVAIMLQTANIKLFTIER